MQKIFISSTSEDLAEYRAAVRDAVRDLGFEVEMMESWPAMDRAAVETCMTKVDSCDLFVGIYAHRYGYVPQGKKVSITELEFNQARERNIPSLCFLIKEDHPWPPGRIEDEPGKSLLRQFKASLEANLVCAYFTTQEDLAFKITKALFTRFMEPPSFFQYPDWLGAQNALNNLGYVGKAKNAQLILLTDHEHQSMLNSLITTSQAEIEIFIQHPDLCNSSYTSGHIRQTIDNLAGMDRTNLNVHLYREHATLKAICIDRKVMVMSWYIYSHSGSKSLDANDREDIWGKSNAHILAKAPSAEYNSLYDTFTRACDFYRANSQSLTDFLNTNPDFLK